MDLSTLLERQREVVTTLDRPLFVSAGAGSGKTFTLTRRILWALSPASGPYLTSLDQVLAITFTRAAAQEIRERVRAALIAEGMDEQALAVDDAWISTIHGMCARMLRAHALELGIDPEFSVLEDTDELIDQAIDIVLCAATLTAGGRSETAASSPAGQPYHKLLSWYRMRGETGPDGSARGASAREFVRRLLTASSSLPHGIDDVRLARGYVDTGELRDAYRQLLDATPAAVRIGERALHALEAFEDSRQTAADVAACMMACDMPRASAACPQEQIAALKGTFAETFVNAWIFCGRDALEELVDLTREVEMRYRALKAERALLDNDDLLRLTYEALRDHAGFRAAYENRFQLIMIDEFQDTDQLQVDLVDVLAGPDHSALCTVGDAQQSIYRFRGAEVEVFRRQERAMRLQEQRPDSGTGAGADAVGGAALASKEDPCEERAKRRPRCESSERSVPRARLVELVRNFRSHADILEYVKRVFDGRSGGLMDGFLDLEPHEGRRDLLVPGGASRRRAVMVVGGVAEDRARAKAKAIARSFRELAEQGQPIGGMVVLLGKMTHADVYAAALRGQGLDAIVAGGSVFSGTDEVRTIRALARALADPADGSEGLVPALASELFALGAEEFLALATAWDPETGETRRRHVDIGLALDEDPPGLGELPLLARAREILRAALSRVGRDPFATIMRDVVNESGWMVRLEARGPQGRAIAANVIKALEAIDEAQKRVGNAPRLISYELDRCLSAKQAPGALNGALGEAVRIMTVHASKGLEFPVVAVADCFNITPTGSRMQTMRQDDELLAVALPDRFPAARAPSGTIISRDKVRKRFDTLLDSHAGWLTLERVEDVAATGSAAQRFLALRDQDRRCSLDERARLLYVAMTRAQEVLILALEASVKGKKKKDPELACDSDRDLTCRVLERIAPDDGTRLDEGKLAFEGSATGDFELISLVDFSYRGESYTASASASERASLDAGGDVDGQPAPLEAAAGDDGPAPDTFTLVYPAHLPYRIMPAKQPPCDVYSYTSLAAALHEQDEDRASDNEIPIPSNEQGCGALAALASDESDEADRAVPASAARLSQRSSDAAATAEDPRALGSAFHAAAQWLIEQDADQVPDERIDALCRLWRVSPAQRRRLEAALMRWTNSRARAELLAWSLVRAEVPFFSAGIDELRDRFGSYALGAIDALGTDPSVPDRALVIDYKTGGSPDETAEQLEGKHALQASVYADVLKRAGFAHLTVKFVRVEIADFADPAQPQVVTYRFG